MVRYREHGCLNRAYGSSPSPKQLIKNQLTEVCEMQAIAVHSSQCVSYLVTSDRCLL